MQEHFGFRSVNGAKGHLDALARKGFLLRDYGRSRGVALAGLRLVARLTRDEAGLRLARELGVYVRGGKGVGDE